MSKSAMDREKPALLSALDAVPEPVPVKSGELAESGESYLETILLIRERTGSGLVRAVDIANELGVSKPSVSRALAQLKEKGLIIIENSGAIVFTPEGFSYAHKVFRRHQILTYFLRYVLEIPSSVAEHDACRMEHVISDITVERMVSFLESHNLLPDEIQKI